MVTTDLDRYRQIMTQLDDWKAFITEPPSVQVAEVHAALALSWRSQSGYAHGYQWTGKSALTKPDLAEAVVAVAAAAIGTNGALELFAQHLQLQGEEAPVATGAAGNA